MILQALCALAESEQLIDDPDFEYKPVSWVVRLKADGTFVSIEDLRRDLNEETGRKAKMAGKNELLPRQPGRTSGDKAFFLVDKAEYALGIDPTARKPAGPGRPKLFREQVEACAEATGDDAVKALVKFLDGLAKRPGSVMPPEEAAGNDLFAFRVGTGPYVHSRAAVVRYWKGLRATPKEEASDAKLRCLVTGKAIGAVELFPLIKRIPGGTPSGVALVSFNAAAFCSYNLSDNENAPIGRQAAEMAAKALNRLLDPNPINGKGGALRRRHLRLSGDTVVVYWSPDEGAAAELDALSSLLEAEDPDAVTDAYRSIWSGRPHAIDNPSAFYALTLTGTQGRAIIRDWFESSVADVMGSLARHFADLSVVRNTNPPKGKTLPPAVALRMLMGALSPPGGNVPASLAADFVHAALRGRPYPMSILQRALLRQRAEVSGDEWIDSARRDARAALIKGVLVRTLNQEVETSMDSNNKNPGYLLGRLMAVLEDTQRLALGRHVNATVKDKFYGAASATPAAVFPAMMDLFHKHCRKAREERPGAVVNREKDADAILNDLGTIPVHLDLTSQGMFVLGYHHQRYALFNKPISDDVGNGDLPAKGK